MLPVSKPILITEHAVQDAICSMFFHSTCLLVKGLRCLLLRGGTAPCFQACGRHVNWLPSENNNGQRKHHTNHVIQVGAKVRVVFPFLEPPIIRAVRRVGGTMLLTVVVIRASNLLDLRRIQPNTTLRRDPARWCRNPRDWSLAFFPRGQVNSLSSRAGQGPTDNTTSPGRPNG